MVQAICPRRLLGAHLGVSLRVAVMDWIEAARRQQDKVVSLGQDLCRDARARLPRPFLDALDGQLDAALDGGMAGSGSQDSVRDDALIFPCGKAAQPGQCVQRAQRLHVLIYVDAAPAPERFQSNETSQLRAGCAVSPCCARQWPISRVERVAMRQQLPSWMERRPLSPPVVCLLRRVLWHDAMEYARDAADLRRSVQIASDRSYGARIAPRRLVALDASSIGIG